MIFHDTVNVTLKEAEIVDGTARFNTVFDGPVPGVVTFLDSKTTFDPVGSKRNSRLQIFLSPFAFEIPADAGKLVVLGWKNFNHLLIEGMVEPHYIRRRLHHYEIIAKAF